MSDRTEGRVRTGGDDSRTRATTAAGPAQAARPATPAGEFVSIAGEEHYRIHGVDGMPPFLMSLPTDTDLWMFVASNGGLTAGRRDPDGALFPYVTVDQLYDAPHHTGPVTSLQVRRGGRPAFAWEPFAHGEGPVPGVERALSKNTTGNQLEFEEIHHDERLAFRARWAASDETGWVRSVTLENFGGETVAVSLLDGLRNLLPAGAPLRLHQTSSCLVDAYKRADLDPGTGLAVYSLTSRIVDRPEPAESLRATTAWCHGLPGARVALSDEALPAFRRGEPVPIDTTRLGRRGHYLVLADLVLEPGASVTWHLGVDTGRSHAQVAALRARLREPAGMDAWIAGSLREATANLRRIVGTADGLQRTGSTVDAVHHFANVLFNSLRGGVFVHDHAFPRADFAAFLRQRSRAVAARHAAFVAALPAEPTIDALRAAAARTGDADLRRLCDEYLPLYFGRRHGDPSRPWNRFTIDVRGADGERALHYEGNWRDVFQNWEALTSSFPGFLPGVIARFVNASTVDGFNPYRITRDGIDWEVPEPGNPWSGIGYWGDHQVVYLLRLLESQRRFAPGTLEALLGERVFSYADVPYRIKPYAELLANPRSTIVFDGARDAAIRARVGRDGGDGKLVHEADGAVRHASLLEKLLVPALAKLGAFVPGGGIWMHTERPEWNDANNALAGTGLSVVTLCHLRRYLRFLGELVADAPAREFPVAAEVAAWLRRVAGILARDPAPAAGAPVDDLTRQRLLDALGGAFSDYREAVYARGLSAPVPVTGAEVAAWCAGAAAHLEHAIRANRREDGLYHAYNLLERSADGTRAAVRHLPVMLEGQVAALASGLVGPAEAADLVDRMIASPLYRADQDSFLLYPDRPLPAFMDRNRVPEARAAAVPLAAALLAAGDSRILERDVDGVIRFHADFANARDLAAALDRLSLDERWSDAVARDRAELAELYIDVFGHRTFTGRSGTMVAYEGLGSIYWHMVSKLLLAVQESALAAHDALEPAAVRERLARAYYRVRGGLGFAKGAAAYGAFPTDPYSHTPAHAGAQQPGMTGSVKEEILARFGELGVRVHDGIVEFDPVLLRPEEFLREPAIAECFAPGGAPRALEVPAGALAFTFAQVPVRYVRGRGPAWVRVTWADGRVTERPGCRLDADESRALLGRLGTLDTIEVGVPESRLFAG